MSVRVRPVQESLDAGAAQESEEQGGDGRSVDNGEIADAGESTSFFYGPGEQRPGITTDENTSAADAEMLGQEPWDSMEEYEYGDRAQGEEDEAGESVETYLDETLLNDNQTTETGTEAEKTQSETESTAGTTTFLDQTGETKAEPVTESTNQGEQVEDKNKEQESDAARNYGATAEQEQDDEQDPMGESSKPSRERKQDNDTDMGM